MSEELECPYCAAPYPHIRGLRGSRVFREPRLDDVDRLVALADAPAERTPRLEGDYVANLRAVRDEEHRLRKLKRGMLVRRQAATACDGDGLRCAMASKARPYERLTN